MFIPSVWKRGKARRSLSPLNISEYGGIQFHLIWQRKYINENGVSLTLDCQVPSAYPTVYGIQREEQTRADKKDIYLEIYKKIQSIPKNHS